MKSDQLIAQLRGIRFSSQLLTRGGLVLGCCFHDTLIRKRDFRFQRLKITRDTGELCPSGSGS